MDQNFRNFAINLLDDEQGINSQAYDDLQHMLYENDDHDIVDAVIGLTEAGKNDMIRYYLPSEVAEQLRSVVKEA